jgi:hypothetical protein
MGAVSIKGRWKGQNNGRHLYRTSIEGTLDRHTIVKFPE